MSNIVVRDVNGEKAISLSINELVNIKGAIFKVRSLCAHPAEVRLQPANAGQIEEYKRKGESSKPSLNDVDKVVSPATEQVSPPNQSEDKEENSDPEND